MVRQTYRYIWTVGDQISSYAEDAGKGFTDLVRIMARLRAPGGCPWDRKQTFDTIKSYLLEETYEVLDAIDAQDWRNLSEELGDLLLQPVFLAEMAAEQQHFTIADCLRAINEKLIRRHPHIFSDATAETADDVKQRWDEIKKQEKAERGTQATALLDEVPRKLPALMEAEKIGKKAAGVGFEWPNVSGVVEKIAEEAAELAEANREADHAAIEHELGDLLFTVVNLSRFLNVDPEQALRRANGRFRQRFGYIESALQNAGTNWQDTHLEQMEALWQEAKRNHSDYNQGF